MTQSCWCALINKKVQYRYVYLELMLMILVVLLHIYSYEKQRILIRSGHTSVFAYLLMSGSVFVNIEEKNKTNGKKYIRTAAVLGRGSLFGVSSEFRNLSLALFPGPTIILLEWGLVCEISGNRNSWSTEMPSSHHSIVPMTK